MMSAYQISINKSDLVEGLCYTSHNDLLPSKNTYLKCMHTTENRRAEHMDIGVIEYLQLLDIECLNLPFGNK